MDSKRQDRNKALVLYSQQRAFRFCLRNKGNTKGFNDKKTSQLEGFYNFLSFLTVPAPDTMFKNIYKLTSGCYLKISLQGDIKITRYWDVFDHTKPLRDISEDEIAEKILEELRIAVKYRKVSDVPVGVFLSGGIDSNTNADV